MKALIITVIILAVIAVILFIPISLRAYFRFNNETVYDFEIKYGFIKLYPSKKRQHKKTDDEDEDKDNDEDKETSTGKIISFVWKNRADIKEGLYELLGYLFKKTVRIKMLNIKLIFGLSDAMETGLLFGIVSAFVFNTLGVMDRKMKLEKHKTELKPVFNNPHIFAEVETVLTTNIWNFAVIAALGLHHIIPLHKKYKQQ